MELSGRLPELIIFRANAGDTKALTEYAQWLKSIEPERFSWQIDGMLAPLNQFPNSPAWTEVWGFLFDDEHAHGLITFANKARQIPRVLVRLPST